MRALVLALSSLVPALGAAQISAIEIGMRLSDVEKLMGGPAKESSMVGACGIMEVHTWPAPAAITLKDAANPDQLAPSEYPSEPVKAKSVRVITTDGVVSTVVH